MLDTISIYNSRIPTYEVKGRVAFQQIILKRWSIWHRFNALLLDLTRSVTKPS